MTSSTPYEVLSFSGGAYKSITYVGALNYLLQKGDLKMDAIHTLQGASAGAVIALCLNLGMTPSDVMHYTYKINILYLLKGDLKKSTLLGILGGKFEGICQGNTLLKKMDDILAHFNGDIWSHTHMTFEELFQKTAKQLIITATNITQKKIVHFSRTNYPNMPILLAIRMSIGVPIYFQPFRFEKDDYIDGDIFQFHLQELFTSSQKILRFRLCRPLKNNDDTITIPQLIKNLLYFYKPESGISEEMVKRIEANTTTLFLDSGGQNHFDFNRKGLSLLYMAGIAQARQLFEEYN